MIHLTAIRRKYRPGDLAALVETTARLKAELAIEKLPERRDIHVEASEKFKRVGE